MSPDGSVRYAADMVMGRWRWRQREVWAGGVLQSKEVEADEAGEAGEGRAGYLYLMEKSERTFIHFH